MIRNALLWLATLFATLLAPTATHAADPFAARPLYVRPASNPARTAAAWASTRPAEASRLRAIAAQPQAFWFDASSARSDISAYVDAAARGGTLPVLVLYNIPRRDCGGYSSGGARSAAAYRHWVAHTFAAAIGPHPAAVIVEPDALAELGCLPPSEQRAYYDLLRYDVATLAAKPGVAVYLDAGNSAWQPAQLMAARLRRAGVAGARGFSLNVSNFNTTAAETAYGRRISRLLGGKPFVIDTSRNGAGPARAGAWCNPPGRALGHVPTALTGDPLVDAYLWVKAPGESDGSCNGGPPSGDWWAQYAVDLARRAGL